MTIATRALGATTLIVLLGATGCGTEGSTPPDGEGPRPVLTREDTPPAPEPDAELTEPSPQEDLTTPLPPPEPEPSSPSPTAPRAPEEDTPPPSEPTAPPSAPGVPDVPGVPELRPQDCEIGDELWDDYLRQWCEEYLPGGG